MIPFIVLMMLKINIILDTKMYKFFLYLRISLLTYVSNYEKFQIQSTYIKAFIMINVDDFGINIL